MMGAKHKAYDVAFLLGITDRLEGRQADPAFVEIADSDVSQGYLEGRAVGTLTDLRSTLVEMLEPVADFPQTEDEARECIHRVVVWFGHECGSCEMLDAYQWADAPSEACLHCGRRIVEENGWWVDPEAAGDDRIWRETCDSHDSFVADHVPVEGPEGPGL